MLIIQGLMFPCWLCVQATCGTCYAVVPFVSRRNVGIVSGVVSAGGAIGGVINQAIFFLNGSMPSKHLVCEHAGRRMPKQAFHAEKA